MPTWLRVRDNDTGHEYDVAEGDPRIGKSMELVKDYPPNSGRTATPRPPKHRVHKGAAKAGNSATTSKE